MKNNMHFTPLKLLGYTNLNMTKGIPNGMFKRV
jgi:hypothetical protein